MVMKTGGRYRRDNIPRGRVSSSRRCQRRQARPRRPRTSASRRCKTDLTSASLLHSLVPPFVPSVISLRALHVFPPVYVPASVRSGNRSFPLGLFGPFLSTLSNVSSLAVNLSVIDYRRNASQQRVFQRVLCIRVLSMACNRLN